MGNSTGVDRATQMLRERLLMGHFPPDEKIGEIALAAELSVSRTLARLAMGAMEREGLLVREPRRGFRVRSFSLDDIAGAIEVRGELEAIAARKLAERGLTAAQDARLERPLAETDRILAQGTVTVGNRLSWTEMNNEFHEAIIDEAGIEWPMDAQLDLPGDAPHSEDDRVFQSRLKAEYRAALGHPITPEGLDAFFSKKRSTGNALLLYLHHTFYSHRLPSEAEIGQLLRWWEGSLLPAMPEQIFPLLGISWVLEGGEALADRAPDALLREEGRLVQAFQNGGVKVWPLAPLKQINVDHLQHFFERVGWPEGWPRDPSARRGKAEQLIADAARAGHPLGTADGTLPESPSLHADWRAVADLLGRLRPQRSSAPGPQPTARRRVRRASP